MPSYWYAPDFVVHFASDSSQIAFAYTQTCFLFSMLSQVVLSRAFCPGPTPRPPMGQASRFLVGVPILRFHASDSEASSPSVASSGFAQVVLKTSGSSFQMMTMPPRLPASVALAPTAAARASDIDTHLRECLSTYVRDTCILQVSKASLLARMPMCSQSLEGVFFRVSSLRLDLTLPRPSRMAASCPVESCLPRLHLGAGLSLCYEIAL